RAPRFDAHVADLPGPRDVADEVQPGCGLLAMDHARCAAIVEHAEVADHSLQVAAIAGRGDDRRRLDPRAVGEQNAGRIERVDPGDDLNPPVLDRLDDLPVHDRGRLALAVLAREYALLGTGEPVLREIAEGETPHD